MSVTIYEIHNITEFEKHPTEVLVAALVSLGPLKITRDNNSRNEQKHQNLYLNRDISET